MDFEEFASALQKAFDDCKVVERVSRFANFTEAVGPYLNTASTTEGADHFNEFRLCKASKLIYVELLHCMKYLCVHTFNLIF
jgi:hypothetical protein